MKLGRELFVFVCELSYSILRNPIVPGILHHVVRRVLDLPQGAIHDCCFRELMQVFREFTRV
jgi:hypothetical protein